MSTPVDNLEFLRLLDEHRQTTTIPGFRRERTAETCRHMDAEGIHSIVLHSRLESADADRIIDREIEHFRALGHCFEWKVFEHDAPADLRHRLVARGFVIEETEAVMVLDLAEVPAPLLAPASADIRPLNDPDKLQDILEVWSRVWPEEDQSHWVRKIAQSMRERPGSVSPYVAYVDGVPAATARLSVAPDDPFGYLGGGATRAEFRGRGLYTDLLRVRVREAVARGLKYLMVDARPMSRPILEKRGFMLVSHAYACNWKPAGSTGR